MEDAITEVAAPANDQFALPNDEFRERAAAAFEESDAIQRFGMFTSLRSALAGLDVELGCLSSQLGLGSISPENITANDYATLLNHVRKNYSELYNDYIASQRELAEALAAADNTIIEAAMS